MIKITLGAEEFNALVQGYESRTRFPSGEEVRVVLGDVGFDLMQACLNEARQAKSSPVIAVTSGAWVDDGSWPTEPGEYAIVTSCGSYFITMGLIDCPQCSGTGYEEDSPDAIESQVRCVGCGGGGKAFDLTDGECGEIVALDEAPTWWGTMKRYLGPLPKASE